MWHAYLGVVQLEADILASKRAAGAALLADQDVPARRQESWRHSNLNLFFGDSSLAAAEGGSAAELSRVDVQEYLVEGAAQLVLVDGVFAPHLSDFAPLAAPGALGDGGGFAGCVSALAAAAESGEAGAAETLGAVMAELDFLPEISAPSNPNTRQGSAALAALNQVGA